MEFKDYYKILGIEKKASAEDIRKAFRKLAKKYHPDRNPGDKKAEEKFKEINEANEVLSDPEKRKKYDQLGSNWNSFQSGAGGSDWFKNYTKGNEGGTFSGNFDDIFSGGSFRDFFEAFTGGSFNSRSGTRTKARKGTNYEANLPITLEEAFNGTTKQFEVNGKTIKIKIDPGIQEGKKLRLKNQGAAGLYGGEKGDLFLNIVLEKHPYFEVKGNDLYYNLDVDIYTAILGGRVNIQTIDGKTINLSIPKETDNGKILRLPGLGMRSSTELHRRGDLFVKINIVIPKNLNAEEIKLFKTLSGLRK